MHTAKALWPHALFRIIGRERKALLLPAHAEFIPVRQDGNFSTCLILHTDGCAFPHCFGEEDVRKKADESSDGEKFTLQSCVRPAHIKCLHLQQIEAADKVKFSSFERGGSGKVHQTPGTNFCM